MASPAENPVGAAVVDEQPFHEAGLGALAQEPAAPSVSDAKARAQEHHYGVNFRDLHSVSPIIQPGRIYRSSQVVSAAELDELGIASVLDLRQPPVTCKTHHANIRHSIRRAFLECLGWLSERVGRGRYSRSFATEAGIAEGGPTEVAMPCHRCSADCCEHYGVPARVYHVDLLPTRVSLRILWELPRSLQAKVLWAAARRRHPEPIVAGAVANPQIMGYLKLYIILLERAQGRLAEALRLPADPGNLPLLAHCIHGKDRTGLVAMLLLLLCGVERQAVVRDYALSEVMLLEGREKRELLGLPEHLTTNQIMASAAAVMEQTIDHIDGRYGSTRNYLKHIGLTDAELDTIKRNLTQPGLVMPGHAIAAQHCAAKQKEQ